MADEHRRDIIVSFRVTALQAAHLDAAGRGLTNPRPRADFCRAAALHLARQKVPSAPSKPVRRQGRRLPALDTRQLAMILAQAGKIGSNVNQLARVANSTGAIPQHDVLTTIATDVAAMRRELTAVLRVDEKPEADDDHQG